MSFFKRCLVCLMRIRFSKVICSSHPLCMLSWKDIALCELLLRFLYATDSEYYSCYTIQMCVCVCVQLHSAVTVRDAVAPGTHYVFENSIHIAKMDGYYSRQCIRTGADKHTHTHAHNTKCNLQSDSCIRHL